MKECVKFLKTLKEQHILKEEASNLFLKKNYQEAVSIYDKCSNLDKINFKFNSTLFYNMALCLFEMKDYEGCLLALDKCIRMNDKYLKAYIKRGDTFMIVQEYQEALNDFNQA